MTTPQSGYGTSEPLPSPGLSDDRALRSFRDLVRAVLPQLALLGLWEYRVESANGGNVVCSPVDASIGLPGAVTAQVVPSVLGERVTPAVGSIVVLSFLNGDAGRPIVIGGDPSSPPTAATIGGLAGASGVARQGDTVTISVAQWNAAAPSNGGGPVVISAPMAATISSGSATIRAGS